MLNDITNGAVRWVVGIIVVAFAMATYNTDHLSSYLKEQFSGVTSTGKSVDRVTNDVPTPEEVAEVNEGQESIYRHPPEVEELSTTRTDL